MSEALLAQIESALRGVVNCTDLSLGAMHPPIIDAKSACASALRDVHALRNRIANMEARISELSRTISALHGRIAEMEDFDE